MKVLCLSDNFKALFEGWMCRTTRGRRCSHLQGEGSVFPIAAKKVSGISHAKQAKAVQEGAGG